MAQNFLQLGRTGVKVSNLYLGAMMIDGMLGRSRVSATFSPDERHLSDGYWDCEGTRKKVAGVALR